MKEKQEASSYIVAVSFKITELAKSLPQFSRKKTKLQGMGRLAGFVVTTHTGVVQ